MCSLVGNEVGVVAKALPTFRAFVGLLSSVDPLMGIEVGAVTKALPTFKAFVGLLTCVYPLVGD